MGYIGLPSACLGRSEFFVSSTIYGSIPPGVQGHMPVRQLKALYVHRPNQAPSSLPEIEGAGCGDPALWSGVAALLVATHGPGEPAAQDGAYGAKGFVRDRDHLGRIPPGGSIAGGGSRRFPLRCAGVPCVFERALRPLRRSRPEIVQHHN